ncbi:hypothetical protein [Variovorax ginsengisoli]|uniref:Lipoprotein n=1 Tax=Variovorax ginsengisoli TaxID=363844 RepID=A0ABT9SGR1_9BURK|nr:hypothetical protein [Variovorax ginsengisoli]MDP9902572.1 hypothetical protein [Variovorax ginsengisoli]
MKRLVATFALAATCLASHAACDTGLAERLHAKLHPDRRLDHELALCEPWRGVLGRYIVVLPLPRASSQQELSTFDLDVLVVQQADNGNTDRARIVSRLYEPSALTEDAIRVSEIKLDSARYMLGKDERAFGLRITHRGASRTNPYESERLSLYVPQGPRLLRLLRGFEVTLERGEWDASCAGSFETVRSGLTVLRSESHGYADLQVRQTRSVSQSSTQGDECVTREQPATFRTATLQFEGSVYSVPRGFTAD